MVVTPPCDEMRLCATAEAPFSTATLAANPMIDDGILATMIARWREDAGGPRLAYGATSATRLLFLVAPDSREEEVRKQVRRPAFRDIGALGGR